MEQVSSNCPSDPALEVIECSKQGGRPQDPIWALACDREGKNCKATCKGCKKGVVYRKVQELYQHAAGCPQLGDSVRSEVQQLAASKGYGYEEAAQQSGSSRRPQPDSIPAAKRHASRGISSMLQHTDPVFNAARKNRIRRAMLIFFVCAAIPWAVADGVPFRSLLKEINCLHLRPHQSLQPQPRQPTMRTSIKANRLTLISLIRPQILPSPGCLDFWESLNPTFSQAC